MHLIRAGKRVECEHGRFQTYLLEKDIWAVWSLRHLFDGPPCRSSGLQGGTSLSDAYGVIRRFSEGVDLTCDIRTIAGDPVGDADAPLPASKSQQKKWSKEIRARLAELVASEIVPRLKQNLEQQSLAASVRAEDPPMLVFPTATPQVMRAGRTFWEKAAAIHVFCAQGTFRGGERFARHWHDVARLDSAGFVDAAIADTALGTAAMQKSFSPNCQTLLRISTRYVRTRCSSGNHLVCSGGSWRAWLRKAAPTKR